MDERLMRAMLDLDEHHWWYRGRRRIVNAQLDQLPIPQPARILDAGCGSGRMLEELARFGEVSGIELDPEAAEVAQQRHCGEVRIGRLEQLPYQEDYFDLITSLDVIEHIPEDHRALVELRRVCKPGGWLLLTVPAYQALWSLHDVANHHCRRYGRRLLRRTAQHSGWEVRRMTSFNMVLLPPAVVVRLAQRHRRPDESYTPELERGTGRLNGPLEWPLRAEASWIAHARTLPVGLSLMAVLRNPGP